MNLMVIASGTSDAPLQPGTSAIVFVYRFTLTV